MKILYIGQYSEGTTSKMRADQLIEILNSKSAEIIDTHIPFFKTNKLFRSFGFRYKKGPLVATINQFIQKNIKSNRYDMIWVDKGVYLNSKTIHILRQKTLKMIHFTPDMAFFENKSQHFEKNLGEYDYCITTKTAETKEYLKRIPESKLLIATQGFSKKIHKPFNEFEEKDNAVVFIGLAETHRFIIAEKLLQAGINLKLVGKNWEPFLQKNNHFDNLNFLGDSIYGEDYSKLISSSKFALGLLSKRFPEFHTTRTFEIPACGTALLTEENAETSKFFNYNEAIFYKDEEDLVKRVLYYMEHPEELMILTQKGYERVIIDGFDYDSILERLLKTILE